MFPQTKTNPLSLNQVFKIWKPWKDCSGTEVWWRGGKAYDRWRHCPLQSTAIFTQTQHHGPHCEFGFCQQIFIKLLHKAQRKTRLHFFPWERNSSGIACSFEFLHLGSEVNALTFFVHVIIVFWVLYMLCEYLGQDQIKRIVRVLIHSP